MTIADLKYAARLLLKRPWFTLLTVLVLAGGLGISIYTFAALDSMIYRDLPLPDGGSIVRIGTDGSPLDAFELAHIREEATTVTEVGAFREGRSLIGEPGASRSTESAEADRGIFEFTRAPPLLGRGFVPADSAASAEPVMVIGYETWQSAFSGDPDIIAELVRVNGRLTRVVGVMPEGYSFPAFTQVWLPLSQQELDPAGYAGSTVEAYARLRPGVAASTAEAELTALLRRIRQQLPDADERNLDHVSVQTFQEAMWGALGTLVFGVLNLLSISILLLAAVNVGNLLLARTNARIKEIGVRIALGAPRWRLIAQTTLENVMLCAIGGALAIFLAARALEATNGFMGALFPVPFWWIWRLDREVVAAAGVFLVLTLAIVSVLPALSVTRADPNAVLKDGARGGEGLRTGRISRALVTVEVALISAVMVVGSAVTAIAERAARFDFGMDTENLYMLTLDLPADRYRSAEERLSVQQALLAEVRATPGVETAAVMQQSGRARFRPESVEYARLEDLPSALLFILSDTRTPVGPTLLAGRAFDDRDGSTGLRTAIVSESLARAHWPNASPIGRRIQVSVGDLPTEQRVIVGVVRDVGYDPIAVSAVGAAAIYVPLQQLVPLPQLVPLGARLIVRHSGGEAEARGAIYEAVAKIDPTIPPYFGSYEGAQATATLLARTMTKLFAGCGAFAILLAITGIYGMSSNAVVLRTHEIGLRRALGASNRNVIVIFIGQGVRQLAVGLAFSGLLSTAVLLAIRQGFSVGGGTLTLIGTSVVLVVSACVLLSIYVSVRSVIRREPSAALRCG